VQHSFYRVLQREKHSMDYIALHVNSSSIMALLYVMGKRIRNKFFLIFTKHIAKRKRFFDHKYFSE